MLRQQFIEKAFRNHLSELGVSVHESTECLDFEVTGSRDRGYIYGLMRSGTGREYSVRSKYLIGADGGKSFVRQRLNIPFEGDTTHSKWIRIDGKVETDLRTARAYGSLESPTHGNVLWAPLDRGITRIGYVYTPEQEKACGGNLTKEVVIREAVAAVRPFKLEFKSVSWWTL